MGEYKEIEMQLVHLARLALTGRRQDILLYIRRLAQKNKKTLPNLYQELNKLLHDSPSFNSPIRSASTPVIPVDNDSRLQLLRVEFIENLDVEPIFSTPIERIIDRIIIERKREKDLIKEGLLPTKSMLFTGAPGVGKTLAAKWLSYKLHWPLLTLDLSAVMSSFLGRTGANLRLVLDYAKSINCILFLDELDAIAKRRDDQGEIGELKRLVTVLLQEIEDWPSTGILIAATNHPDLLDPAIWRRFDVNLQFPMPNQEYIRKAVHLFFGSGVSLKDEWVNILVAVLQKSSFNDVERSILNIRREAIIRNVPIEQPLMEYINKHIDQLSHKEKVQVSTLLIDAGISQRQAHEITGISRDTIRKKIKSDDE